jgi:L-threonylcarbamoyladenylate synthase
METQTLPTDQPQLMNHAVNEAVKLLRAGDIVALPTETVYGLAADALNADAVAKVFAAKERPSFDPLIVHLPQKTDLALVADVPPEIQKVVTQLIERFWPGPLTLVLPKKPNVPDIVTAGLPTVAVRCSSNPVFARVVKELGKPIAAPSANRFGSISPTSASAVKAELDGRIPLILDGGASLHGLESTIIKVEQASSLPVTPSADATKMVAPPSKPHITILRPGPIIPDDLKQYGRIQRVNKKLTDEAAEAPGQLASHYAPRTPLRLLERPSDFIPERGKSYALLSYRGDADDGYLHLTDWKHTATLSPGKGKLPEAAVRFFYVLRELDKCGADEIIAEPIHEFGLGIAMMDRLRRAAVKVVQPARLHSEKLEKAEGSLDTRANQRPEPVPHAINIFSQVQYFDPRADIENEERNLPHWRQPGTTYFVTFRLGDAIPQEKLQQLRHERAEWFSSHPQPWSDEDRAKYHRIFSERVQEWLDAGHGSCLLRDERAASIVADCLRHFDGQRYDLLAWVVMPNHVHALVSPHNGFHLDQVLHTWKSFSAHEIKKCLGRTGEIWQHEGYDHIVRNPEALWMIAKYIVDNPRKASITTRFVESRIKHTRDD